jgi:hypothetical protein
MQSSTASWGCASSADGQAGNTSFSFPEAVPVLSNTRSVSGGQHLGSAAMCVKGSGKLSSVADINKGRMPQVRKQLVEFH